MRLIKSLFDSNRKHFSKGGKLEKLGPLFEATETFFFIPAIVSQTYPHVRDSLDLKRFMSFVILALVPPTLWGIYNTGYQSHLAAGLSTDLIPVIATGLTIVLPPIIVSYTVGFFWELLFATIRRHHISEGFLVTGLLFPLTLPPSIPLWQVAVGISFGVVIGKEIFGGTGRNILNPALTARAFVFFAYPSQLSGNVWVALSDKAAQTVDAFSGATPLSLAAITEQPADIEKVLSKAGFTFSNLFWGHYPSAIGASSTFCCLIGCIFLLFVGIISYRIIFGGILGVLATAGLINILSGATALPFHKINPLYHLVMGGFAFGLVYMASEPVTAPGMNFAKWAYGFLIGFFTVVIRVFNPAFPEGVMLAILFMNIFAPLLDHFEIKARLNKRIKNV